jgi:hypothetical protein
LSRERARRLLPPGSPYRSWGGSGPLFVLRLHQGEHHRSREQRLSFSGD